MNTPVPGDRIPIESPFKTMKMYLVCCSCGGIVEGNQGAVMIFKDVMAARLFINANAPQGNPEHYGVVQEISLMVPNHIRYEE